MSAAPWGYAEFLEAITDPGHERHAELKEWIAEDFDPNVIDADRLGEQVAQLAKRWSRIRKDLRFSPYAEHRLKYGYFHRPNDIYPSPSSVVLKPVADHGIEVGIKKSAARHCFVEHAVDGAKK